MNKKALKIINHYGIDNQLRKFQEEVFELSEAIIEDRFTTDFDYSHIEEELSDVLVLLSQFKEFYDISDKTIKDMMNYKINRTLDRIKGE